MTLSTIDISTPANNTPAGLGALQIRTLKDAVRDQFPDVSGDAWNIPLTVGPRAINAVSSKVDQADFDELEARVSVNELALLNQAAAIVALGVRTTALEGAGYVTSSGASGAAWPVGSIFISYDGNSPSAKGIAGTWSAFGVGSVLLGASTGFGGTGGSMSMTLSVANLPAHDHFSFNADGPLNPSSSPVSASNYPFKLGDTGGSAAYLIGGNSTVPSVGKTSPVGSGTAKDITPAHVKVAFYRRTA